jgi:hypothetical protein
MTDKEKLREHYRTWLKKQAPQELKRKSDKDLSTLSSKRQRNNDDKENVESNTVDSNLSEDETDSTKSSSGQLIQFVRGNVSLYIQKGKILGF